MSKYVFGIDLGTTYSCIARVDDTARAEVIKNNDGKNYKLYRQTKWYLKSSYVKCTDDISLSIVMQELYKISNI